MTSPRFYATWAFAMLLALVLPVAIPYAIWPPTALVGTSNDCAGRAISATRYGTHFTAPLLPLSADEGDLLLPFAALTSGVFLVSLPFVLALVHVHLRTRETNQCDCGLE